MTQKKGSGREQKFLDPGTQTCCKLKILRFFIVDMRGGLHFMVVAGGFFSFFNTVALPVSKPKC
jgi:hypothetical protein